MFFYHKQLQSPTGIENAVYCNFTSSSEKQLVVAGVNFITVYRLIPDFSEGNVGSSAGGAVPLSAEDSGKTKFEYIVKYSFNGNVTSLASARLAGSPRDLLLITFQDAKLSVIEYDLVIDNIKVLSLHHFEEDDMKCGSSQFPILPFVRVDPDQRCAAMAFFGRMLAILPFRKDAQFAFADNKKEKAKEGMLMPSTTKCPIQNSYIISLPDMDGDKIDNVVDVQFLHGYFEPTIVVLYEPQKTWPARVAVRHDTFSMVGISLNIQQKVHPIIWSLSNLPFDCFRVLPVPKPIGGAVILAVNSLIYVNQSVPPYGVSLNSVAERSSNFPLKPYEGVKIALDCCTSAFLSPERILLSLKNGDLYVLTLLADPMRSVRGVNLERAAGSVLTTCITACEENHIFLGSRLGNSLLLRYREQSAKRNPALEPSQKKKRIDTDGDWMETDDQDAEDIELYGHEVASTQAIIHYQFEVCDSLLNIGPCGNVSIGQPFARSQEFEHSEDPDIECVTTSGAGKNGALCVLQRTVRPQIVTTFEVSQVKSIWTVFSSQPLEPGKQPLHSHLLISREDNTMVLETGEEINDVREDNGFDLVSPTIFACNLGNRQYSAQVTAKAVRLLEGSDLVNLLDLEPLGSVVKFASSADPYISLWMSDDTVAVVVLVPGPKLDMFVKRNPVKSPISALCCYRDLSGIFTSAGSVDEIEAAFAQKKLATPVVAPNDEESYLYGESVARNMMNSAVFEEKQKKSFRERWAEYMKEPAPTYWLFVANQDGSLRIFSLPSMQLAFQSNSFSIGSRLVVDVFSSGSDDTHVPTTSDTPTIHELLVVGLGYRQRRPIILARVGDEDLLVYEVIQSSFGLTPEQLKIKFRKIDHGLILRDRRTATRRRAEAEVQVLNMVSNTPQYHFFANISGYSGVFLGGTYPYWMFMTSRGELRFHPMPIDGSVVAFAPFNNVNCPTGFLYFNKKEEMRIAVLPTHLVYDADWPVRKVPLRVTPHMIGYHMETKTYIVSTSEAQTTNKIYRFNGDDKELCTEERDDRFPYPPMDIYSVQLFSPVTWEAIPGASMTMDDWEFITCLKIVSLAYEGHASGRKDYIAISTNYSYGEDVVSRGRVIIMDIIEVVPEPGQPLTKNKLKTLYAKEQKGPVTCIGQVNGFLITAIGQKLYIWQFKDNDLVGTAFIDSDIFIHQLVTVKNFILVADVFKSVTLLMYQEEHRTLCVVSRGPRAVETYATDFVIDNTEMGFLITDADKNLSVYMYLPEARESNGGQRLVRKGDFYLGQHVTSIFRVRCRITDVAGDRRHPAVAEKKHVTYMATLDGAINYLLPLAEKTFRRLQMLQNILATSLAPRGGLNHKAFRTFKPRNKPPTGPVRGILDGDLISQFLHLSSYERLEVAKRLGTKPEELLDDLLEVDREQLNGTGKIPKFRKNPLIQAIQT